MDTRPWKLVLGAGALAVAVAAGAGLAQAVPTTTVSPPDRVPAAVDSAVGADALLEAAGFEAAGLGEGELVANDGRQAHKGRRGLFRALRHRLDRLVHAEAVLNLPERGLTTFSLDHGTITAISASSISVKASNGVTVTVATNAATRVRREGAPKALSDLKVGDEAVVYSVSDEKEPQTARRIVVPTRDRSGEDPDS